jgi:hypothetical protein
MSGDKENLSRNEWLVLSSLSDDWECLSSINKPEVSRADMVELLDGLYGKGLICIEKGVPFDRKILLEEPNEYWDTNFWFGLTEKGCQAWEDDSRKYGESPVDWRLSWKGCFSPEKGGYIEGVSEKICEQILKDCLKRTPFKVSRKSITHKKIEGFQAKYYKYIPGGDRIDFKTKRSIWKTMWLWALQVFGK